MRSKADIQLILVKGSANDPKGTSGNSNLLSPYESANHKNEHCRAIFILNIRVSEGADVAGIANKSGRGHSKHTPPRAELSRAILPRLLVPSNSYLTLRATPVVYKKSSRSGAFFGLEASTGHFDFDFSVSLSGIW